MEVALGQAVQSPFDQANQAAPDPSMGGPVHTLHMDPYST